ncbi:hypothetical protein ABPG72_017798 [Tetrahymena utriculariae]
MIIALQIWTRVHYSFVQINSLYTQDIKDTKQVKINYGKLEKQKLTIFLSAGVFKQSNQGFTLKSIVIFKNQPANPHSFLQLQKAFKGEFEVTYSSSGCLLVVDTYKCHQDVKIKQILNKNDINLLFLPGGTTFLLQPLDVAIMKPFKYSMNNHYLEWQYENQSSNLKSLLKKSQFLKWIVNTNQNIEKNLIVRPFKMIGITLQLDKLSIKYLSEAVKEICNDFLQLLKTFLLQ